MQSATQFCKRLSFELNSQSNDTPRNGAPEALCWLVGIVYGSGQALMFVSHLQSQWFFLSANNERTTRGPWEATLTPFMVTAVWTLEATASTLEAMRSQLTPSFFLRMAFSAYTLAHSTFFCCRAWSPERPHTNTNYQLQATLLSLFCWKTAAKYKIHYWPLKSSDTGEKNQCYLTLENYPPTVCDP